MNDMANLKMHLALRSDASMSKMSEIHNQLETKNYQKTFS